MGRRPPLMPVGLRGAAALLALLALVALARHELDYRHAPRAHLAMIVAATPDRLRSVVAESGEGRAELRRAASGWEAVGATAPPAADLLDVADDNLFPLSAVRDLKADGRDPQFGITEGGLVLTVADGQGAQRVSFGGPSFTGGGVYAQSSRRPGHVYVVPRALVAQVRSIAAGRVIEERDAKLDRKIHDLENETTPGDEADNIVLQQAERSEGGGQDEVP